MLYVKDGPIQWRVDGRASTWASAWTSCPCRKRLSGALSRNQSARSPEKNETNIVIQKALLLLLLYEMCRGGEVESVKKEWEKLRYGNEAYQ